MEYVVKGGFPRIYVEIRKLDSKKEQGFTQYSIKNIMKMKTKHFEPLQINVSRGNVVQSEDIQMEKMINGIPISFITN